METPPTAGLPPGHIDDRVVTGRSASGPRSDSPNTCNEIVLGQGGCSASLNKDEPFGAPRRTSTRGWEGGGPEGAVFPQPVRPAPARSLAGWFNRRAGGRADRPTKRPTGSNGAGHGGERAGWVHLASSTRCCRAARTAPWGDGSLPGARGRKAAGRMSQGRGAKRMPHMEGGGRGGSGNRQGLRSELKSRAGAVRCTVPWPPGAGRTKAAPHPLPFIDGPTMRPTRPRSRSARECPHQPADTSNSTSATQTDGP